MVSKETTITFTIINNIKNQNYLIKISKILLYCRYLMINNELFTDFVK